VFSRTLQDYEINIRLWNQHKFIFIIFSHHIYYIFPPTLLSEATASKPDPLTDTFPPMLIETHKAVNKVKAGKAPGSCGIYPEYILHGGTAALRTLHSIFTCVWEDEVIPEKWHQGIIILLYKGKGSRSDCSNYRGITLPLVPGKVFAHVILARIRPTLMAHRRSQQSGFTPDRSTCDRIATLYNIALQWQDYGHTTYVAYVDLHAAFDSLSRSSLWLLLARLGIPDNIVRLIKALYSNSVSCISASQSESAWFTIEYSSPRVSAGTRLFHHRRGLAAGK